MVGRVHDVQVCPLHSFVRDLEFIARFSRKLNDCFFQVIRYIHRVLPDLELS